LRIDLSFAFRALGLYVLCLCGNGLAQAPAATNTQEPALRIKTELLQLRAVITDKQGNVIEGLQATDFEILENNRPQKIEFFAQESVAERRAAAPAATEPPASGAPPRSTPVQPTRTIALFVDNVHLSFDSLARTKEALRHFVNEQMTKNDLVCIVTAAGSLGLVNQFTQDRQVLLRAIEKLSLWRITDKDTLLSPYLAARVTLNIPEALVLGMMILESENPTIKGNPPRLLEAELRARSAILLAETSHQRRVMLSTLKALTERPTELPGQRLLFCFSEGFSLAGIGGNLDNDDLTPTISQAVRAGVILYTFGAQGPTVPVLTASHPGIIEGVRQYTFSSQTRSAAITVPTIPSYLTARNSDQKIGLTTLALDTGGKPFFETNDLNGRLAQALAENRVYYSLSYYPEDANNPKKPRKLTLRVKGHPEYEIRTQRSYIPAELGRAEKEAASLTPRQRLARALISPLPLHALELSVSADYFEREGDPNLVLLQTYLETDKVDYQLKDGTYVFALVMATAIYDQTGKLIQGWSDELNGGFKAEQLESAKRAGYQPIKWLSLKPGLYQVRVGVLEPGTERMGTAAAWVEVPKQEANKMRVSNLLLLQQSSNAATTNLPRAQFRQGIRVYQRGETLSYFLRVYPPATLKTAATDITLQTQVVQDDRPVFQSQWLPLSARTVATDKISAEINGELKLNTIKPGLYELRMLVKSSLAEAPHQQTVLFLVE